MTKEEFTKLDILEQVKYINSRTITGLKVTEVAKEINISDKTLRTKLKENNYVFDRPTKIYSLTGNNTETPKETFKSNNNVIPKEEPKGNIEVITKVKENNNSYFTKEEVLSIRKLLEVKKTLLTIAEVTEHNKGINILEVINLDRSNRKKATFNMDISIIEKLKVYEGNSNTSKSDIVNIALKEYLRNN